MNGMNWIASTMEAAQARLETATTNLANAHVGGYRPLDFNARLTENGIRAETQGRATADRSSRPGGPPLTDSTHEMVEVLQAQRSFETAQKTALAFENVRSKEAQELARPAQ